MNTFEHKGKSTFLERKKYKLFILSFEAWVTTSGFPAQKLHPRFYKRDTKQKTSRPSSEPPKALEGHPSPKPGLLILNRFMSLLDFQTDTALGHLWLHVQGFLR